MDDWHSIIGIPTFFCKIFSAASLIKKITRSLLLLLFSLFFSNSTLFCKSGVAVKVMVLFMAPPILHSDKIISIPTFSSKTNKKYSDFIKLFAEVGMMNFGESLKKALKDEYDRGAKYQEMAKSHGVSYAYIHGLINGTDKCGGVSLDKLQRMFPHAELNLHPSPVSMQQANGNTNSQISQTMGAADAADAVARYRQALSDAILSLAIPADAKVAVLELLKNTAQ